MAAHPTGTSPSPRGPTRTLTPHAEVQRMLTRVVSRSDRDVGTMALTQRLWRELDLDMRLPARQRGRTMRELLSHLIEAHHARAATAVECRVCAHLATPEYWQALWLSYAYIPDVGFLRRFMDEELIALGRYVAKNGDQALHPARRTSAPRFLQDITDTAYLAEIFAACPQKRTRGKRQGTGYGERMYSQMRTTAIAALLCHLEARDDLVTGFVEARPELHAQRPSSKASRMPPPCRRGPRRAFRLARPTRAAKRRERVARQRGRLLAHVRRLIRLPQGRGRRRILATGAMFTALLLLVITGFITAVPDTSQTLGSAGLSGYLLAQQYGAHEQRTLTILDLRTGRWRPLWPDSAPASQAADTYGHPTAPAYAAASGTLAFILQTSAQKSIWRASLRAGADGWPSVGEPSPLLADCGGCAALSWSPSGRWLVYDTQSGLMALDTTTGERRQLTSERGDAWPACSPDGRWLAYQRASTAIADIVVLPAADCLPVSSADRAPAYLEGYRPSWRPAWAPDSRHLAFTSNVLGVAHVYVAALAALPPSAAGGVTAAVLVSPGGCEDPAWAPGGAERGAVVIATCDALHAANHQSALVLAATRDSLAWQLRVDEGALMRVTLCWVPAPFLGPRARPQPALDATIIMWAPTAPRLPLSLTTP